MNKIKRNCIIIGKEEKLKIAQEREIINGFPKNNDIFSNRCKHELGTSFVYFSFHTNINNDRFFNIVSTIGHVANSLCKV